MRRTLALRLLLLILAFWALGTAAEDGQLPALEMHAFDPAAIDASADPCEDFYQYACGGWHENHPRPPDVTFWARLFTQFEQQVDDDLRAMIQHQARDQGERSADEQKVGDFFAACMDTATLDARGLAPLEPELAVIDGMSKVDRFAAVLGMLTRSFPHREGGILFILHLHGDPEAGGQAKRMWIEIGGSLGLSNDDTYLREGESAEALRAAYRDHVARSLVRTGTAEAEASRLAERILALETALAKSIPSASGRNDASSFTHLMTLRELQSLTPSFRWADFFRALDVEQDDFVNVTHPPYLEALDGLLRTEPLEIWKAYLRWRLVQSRANLLDRESRDAHFDFYGRALGGLDEQQDRALTCSQELSRYLPAALSRVFLEQGFDPEIRPRALEIFERIRAVMRRRIEQPEWLAPGTKAAALEKLEAMRVTAVHPGRWLDERRVVIRRDDHYGNARRAAEALRRAAFADLGSPIDPDAWRVPTTIAYGYNDAHANAIMVTAGMLLFYQTDDPAVLYAGVGVTMAHEILHGFDSLGRAYDAAGRLRDWWTESDAESFEHKTRCLAEHFSSLEYAPGIALDGDYLVSEQTAELGAWSIAWEAYLDATAGAPPSNADGFSASQRYFLTNAQTWCTDATEQGWRDLVHGGGSKAWGAPMVNGLVVHLPEFREAFGCRAEDPMTLPPKEMCEVW